MNVDLGIVKQSHIL